MFFYTAFRYDISWYCLGMFGWYWGSRKQRCSKRVAAASLSDVNCSLSWAREKKKKSSHLSSRNLLSQQMAATIQIEFIAQNLLSLTAVEQRQKMTTNTLWLRNLLSLKNTGSQVPDRRFVKSCRCLRAASFGHGKNHTSLVFWPG